MGLWSLTVDTDNIYLFI